MSELNLIPDHIKQKRMMRAAVGKSSAAVLLVVALLAAVAVIPYVRLNKLNEKELSLQASIESAKPIIVENERLKKETASYKEYIDIIEKVQKSNVSVFPVFKSFEKYLPQDVVVKSFSFAAGSINISASTKNYNSINELEANLQESKEFTNSNVTSITTDEKTGEYTFTLIIKNVKGEVK